MVDSSAFLSERLRSEGEKALTFFRELSSQQWELTVYIEESSGVDDWRVRDVLAHFVSAESGFASLIEEVANGGEGTTPDFDIDAFNQREVAELRPRSADELLAEFAVLRQANVNRVARLNGDDLARQGRHPFLGLTPLADMIKMIYRHNQLHLRDLRRALQQ